MPKNKQSTMKGLIHFFQHYRKLCPEALDFIQSQGKIKTYVKNEWYKQEEENIPKWCFVLDGLVAKIGYKNGNNEYIERLCPAQGCFTGSKHAYSNSREPLAIQFLQPTTLYEIPITALQEALIKFPELREIYQILQQHRQLRLQEQVHILRLPVLQRLHALFSVRPQIFAQLTVAQRMSYLGISNFREYYKALHYHMRQ